MENNEWMDFISVFRRKIRLIIYFVCSVCIITAVITFFIPKEFTSSAVIFPTDSNSLDDILRNPQFGYDVEADRLIQLLQSRVIRDSIINKFNLLEYYDIDKSREDWDYLVAKEYQKDIGYSKTIFMSVVITARTRDPEMSSNIVNEIISLVGKSREKLLKQNILLARSSLEREYGILKNDLDSLSASLDRMALNEKSMKQFVQSDRSIALIFDKDQMKDDQAAKAMQLVVNQYNLKLTWFFDVQNKLKAANLILQRPLPTVYIVESAIPSYKKSFPSYGVNLLVAFASSLIFISFFFFFMKKIRIYRLSLKEYEVVTAEY